MSTAFGPQALHEVAPNERSDGDTACSELRQKIDLKKLPRHVAIIMDGNGRWARLRDHSRIKGHKAAIPAVQDVVEACVELKIAHLTLFAFSTENWKRPAKETGTLMALLRQFLRIELKSVHENRIRVQAIGAVDELAPGIQKDLRRVVRLTAENDGLRFNLALNYSGRQDILQAARSAIRSGLDPGALDEASFEGMLSTAGQPDPDLVIRTSGEYRVSNFLLWQIAYSEIWVTSTYWPDFRRGDLYRAILDYQSRNRRFGGI